MGIKMEKVCHKNAIKQKIGPTPKILSQPQGTPSKEFAQNPIDLPHPWVPTTVHLCVVAFFVLMAWCWKLFLFGNLKERKKNHTR
jgi:hypothetical protein